ncbi:ABC transporter substrate-binding protein [Microbacterium sp. I2]|uniref:ABC transporter substrate-binding protein n=1 Tax=Microbacterium sp. I2 TaxID=3391826 RepID=UPI003EDA4A98
MSKWMSVRRGALAAVVAVGMVSVAACSGGGGGGAGSDSSTATEGDLIWWGWTPDKPVADQLIAKFNEEYPDIAVEFVSKPIDTYDSLIGPAITSSEGPDIFNLAPGSANGGVGVFHAGAMDLGPVVEEALGEDWQDQLAATGVEGLTVDGKVAALSAGAVYSGGLWINKDIFDQHGLTAPTTMAEWQSVCETLEAAGQGCFIQGAGQNGFNMDTFEAIMENVEPGAYVAASQDEKSYTDPEFVEGLEIWKSLFDDGIMQEGAVGVQQYPEANNAFMKGEYAMIMMGSWYTQYTVRDIMTGAMSAAGVADPEPFTMVPIPFPDLAGTGNVGSMFGDADYGLAINAQSDQQAAAETFVLWLTTSEEGQQAVANTLNDIPSLVGIQPEWDSIELVDPEVQRSLLIDYTEQASESTQPRFATVSPDLNGAFEDVLIGVASGSMSVDEGLETLQAAADAD